MPMSGEPVQASPDTAARSLDGLPTSTLRFANTPIPRLTFCGTVLSLDL